MSRVDSHASVTLTGEVDTAVDPNAAAKVARAFELEPGARLGRYVVTRMLGSGAMGVVYQAYDPELDRMVAVKMLRSRGRSEKRHTARTRLQREAQALAKLQHPNVVAVHDVGVHDGELFIAMELVEGQTLRQWWGTSASWRETMRVLIAAGEGLAAAHRQGLVHRDFKPSNVLVGADGRPRVLDFGLVVARGSQSVDASASRATGSLTDETLTRRGHAMGTPAYMSPEQHHGEPADERSDAYAFCVAAWEALYDARPFTARSFEGLAAAKVRPKLTAPAGTKVPRAVHRILMRGMRPDPAERYPDMDSLLADLRRAGSNTRRILLATIAASAAGAFAWFGLAGDPPGRCEDADDPVDAVWTDDARAQIRGAMGTSAKVHLEAAWTRAEADLDAYTRALAAARRDACTATWVRREQPEEVMHRRMVCLDAAVERVAGLVRVFQSGEDGTVYRAQPAILRLPSPQTCSGPNALADRAVRPSNDETRRRGDAALVKIAGVEALKDTGRYAAARAALRLILDSIEGADDPMVLAAALLQQGTLEDRLGDAKAAEATLHRGLLAAEESRAARLEARIWTMLAWVVGYRQSRHAEGLRHGRHAEAVLRGNGGGVELKMVAWSTLGSIHFSAGEFSEAQRLHERALEAGLEAGLNESPRVAAPMVNLGLAYYAQQQPAAAAQQFERALAIEQNALGAAHPRVGVTLDNLAIASHDLGDHDRAEELLARALELQRQALGDEHPKVALSMRHLASVRLCQGRLDEAARLLDGALSIYDDGPARMRSIALVLRGDVDLRQGQAASAKKRYAEAMELDAVALPSDHVDRAFALTGMGQALLAAGDPEMATPHLQDARRLRADSPDHVERAEVLFALARAVAASDPETARTHAATARDHFTQTLDRARDRSAEVDAWLAEAPG